MSAPDTALPQGTNGTWTTADYESYEVLHLTTPEHIQAAHDAEPLLRLYLAALFPPDGAPQHPAYRYSPKAV
ncbi:hypothetical protein ABZ404_36870 [Streptomyces sp. NPDC005878]|uniref:hypothetical protein n=1 Tax=Streptomyces sp. NPDC005878 TaxID=3157077 RepID=UPI00340C88A4